MRNKTEQGQDVKYQVKEKIMWVIKIKKMSLNEENRESTKKHKVTQKQFSLLPVHVEEICFMTRQDSKQRTES